MVTVADTPGRNSDSVFGMSTSTRSERFDSFSDQLVRVTFVVMFFFRESLNADSCRISIVDCCRLKLRNVDKHPNLVGPRDNEQLGTASGSGLNKVARVDLAACNYAIKRGTNGGIVQHRFCTGARSALVTPSRASAASRSASALATLTLASRVAASADLIPALAASRDASAVQLVKRFISKFFRQRTIGCQFFHSCVLTFPAISFAIRAGKFGSCFCHFCFRCFDCRLGRVDVSCRLLQLRFSLGDQPAAFCRTSSASSGTWMVTSG